MKAKLFHFGVYMNRSVFSIDKTKTRVGGFQVMEIHWDEVSCEIEEFSNFLRRRKSQKWAFKHVFPELFKVVSSFAINAKVAEASRKWHHWRNCLLLTFDLFMPMMKGEAIYSWRQRRVKANRDNFFSSNIKIALVRLLEEWSERFRIQDWEW